MRGVRIAAAITVAAAVGAGVCRRAVGAAAGAHPGAGVDAAGPDDRPGLCWSRTAPMAELTKIGPAHLRREAWVYVRQSTMTQVRENTESLKRQYELVERAHPRLGWPADRVRVIDDDLGCSGAEATARAGFQGLVAAVGLGQVGLVLGIEVSRLARRNADWYHLLDLCAMTDTLIADADGLYQPGDYNDRLVLGLKGTMSEAELHVLRSRLDAGLRHKATQGELRQLLPVGLDYDEDGRIVVSPDEAVRAAIAAVFDRFDELGSARQVVLALRADGLGCRAGLPARGSSAGPRRLIPRSTTS